MSANITQQLDTKKTRNKGGLSDAVHEHYAGLSRALSFPASIFAQILYEEHGYGYQQLADAAAKRGYFVSKNLIRERFPKKKGDKSK